MALLVPGIARSYKPAPILIVIQPNWKPHSKADAHPLETESDIPHHPSNEGFYFSVCSDPAAGRGVGPPPLVRVIRGRR